jgi:hypothetical protein
MPGRIRTGVLNWSSPSIGIIYIYEFSNQFCCYIIIINILRTQNRSKISLRAHFPLWHKFWIFSAGMEAVSQDIAFAIYLIFTSIVSAEFRLHFCFTPPRWPYELRNFLKIYQEVKLKYRN